MQLFDKPRMCLLTLYQISSMKIKCWHFEIKKSLVLIRRSTRVFVKLSGQLLRRDWIVFAGPSAQAQYSRWIATQQNASAALKLKAHPFCNATVFTHLCGNLPFWQGKWFTENDNCSIFLLHFFQNFFL